MDKTPKNSNFLKEHLGKNQQMQGESPMQNYNIPPVGMESAPLPQSAQNKNPYGVRYDVVHLPSRNDDGSDPYYNGLFNNGIMVYDLVAYDETLLLSPNMVQRNDFLETLLQEKCRMYDGKESLVPIGQLLIGDRDYLLIVLRLSLDHTIKFTLTDPNTGVPFEYTYDLQNLTARTVNQYPDSNGEFTFTWVQQNNSNENTERSLTFRLTTVKDEMLVRQKTEQEKKVHNKDKAINHILALQQIVTSVDGVREPSYIRNAVAQLPLMVSRKLREAIRDCSPGLEYQIEVEAPSGARFRHNLTLSLDLFYLT